MHIPCRTTGSFPCDSQTVAVHSENIYTVEPNRVQIRTPQVCFSTRSLHFSAWRHTIKLLTISLGQLFCPGHCQAAAGLLQSRRKSHASQCVSVLPCGRYRHRTHLCVWPLPKVCWYYNNYFLSFRQCIMCYNLLHVISTEMLKLTAVQRIWLNKFPI